MSLLPVYRGWALKKAIRKGVRIAGVTLHVITENMVDDEPIVAQCCVGVLEDDTEGNLGKRIFPNLREHVVYCTDFKWSFLSFCEGAFKL